MTDLHFRTANPADVGAIVALVESAYRGDASRQGWTTEADFLDGRRTGADEVLASIERARSVILLAERAGATDASGDPQPVACAHVAEDDGGGYFGMFSVRPELQGSGVGKQLLSRAERLVFHDWKLPVMRMTVIDIRHELIAFYERRGYRRTGVHRPFPYGDPRFGLPKRDDLRFEILEKTAAGAT